MPMIIMPTATAMRLKTLNSISTIRRQVKIAGIAKVAAHARCSQKGFGVKPCPHT